MTKTFGGVTIKMMNVWVKSAMKKDGDNLFFVLTICIRRGLFIILDVLKT